MEPVETITYRGIDIEIYQDEDPESPREWDNLGTMVCFHRNYNLGDENHGFDEPEDLLDFVNGKEKAIALPLFLLDHSGLWISTGRFACDSGGWDTSHVGFIIISKEKIRQEYHVKRISKKLLNKVTDILVLEVETYNRYLTGDVYGYSIDKTNDSCYGIFGHDWETNGLLEYAQDSIDCYITNRKKEHAGRVKAWIHNHVPLENRFAFII